MTFEEFLKEYHISLTNQQLEAVRSVDDPTLLLADNGAGIVQKVELSTRRAQYTYLVKVAAACTMETTVLYRHNAGQVKTVKHAENREA